MREEENRPLTVKEMGQVADALEAAASREWLWAGVVPNKHEKMRHLIHAQKLAASAREYRDGAAA